jgi:hypothetical protein
MATKKSTKKKSTKSKKAARKKATPMKAVKRPTKLAKKKPAPKRREKKKASDKKQTRQNRESLGAPEFSPRSRRSLSGEQSGDLQGLSRLEAADSESVDELLAEGNAFEADAVIGVEDADSADEKEVRTHEVPEDDVPGEYLDKE